MWFDSNKEKLIWGYCLEHGNSESHPYDEVEFEGGLYAIAVSIDENDREGERIYAGIKQWIDSQECLALDDSEGRFVLFHVISSDKIKEALGYTQLDVFVPIKIM